MFNTFVGCGTGHYSWKHFEDRTATAVKWLSILYIPIFPIKKYKFKITDNEPKYRRVPIFDGLRMSHNEYVSFPIELIDSEPMVLSEILSTYVKTVVAFALLLSPIIYFGIRYSEANASGYSHDNTENVKKAGGIFLASWIYFLIFGTYLRMKLEIAWNPSNHNPE